MDIKIVHCKRSAPTLPKDQVIYLERTIGKSQLSNMWTHLPVNNTRAKYQVKTVEEAVEKYEEWLKSTVLQEQNVTIRPISSLLRSIYTICKVLTNQKKTVYLACWCMDELNPKPYDHGCHCQVVRRVLIARHNKDMN